MENQHYQEETTKQKYVATVERQKRYQNIYWEDFKMIKAKGEGNEKENR